MTGLEGSWNFEVDWKLELTQIVENVSKRLQTSPRNKYNCIFKCVNRTAILGSVGVALCA